MPTINVLIVVGIPVCHGMVTAKVRVAKTLKDAQEMQVSSLLNLNSGSDLLAKSAW